MFWIANQQQQELKKLLLVLTKLPGIDAKTSNIRRKAKLAISKLERSKKVKNTTK